MRAGYVQPLGGIWEVVRELCDRERGIRSPVKMEAVGYEKHSYGARVNSWASPVLGLHFECVQIYTHV